MSYISQTFFKTPLMKTHDMFGAHDSNVFKSFHLNCINDPIKKYLNISHLSITSTEV